jgi:hypothetical protein
MSLHLVITIKKRFSLYWETSMISKKSLQNVKLLTPVSCSAESQSGATESPWILVTRGKPLQSTRAIFDRTMYDENDYGKKQSQSHKL